MRVVVLHHRLKRGLLTDRSTQAQVSFLLGKDQSVELVLFM